MDIYIVKAMSGSDGYRDSVSHLDNMKETKLSYSGNGRVIRKAKIGVLEEGSFYGSFKIAVTSKDDIHEARERLRDKVYRYNANLMTKYTEYAASAMSYSLEDNEIKITSWKER